MQGSYEPWVEEQRTYYREQYLRLLESLAGAAETATDWQKAMQLAQLIVREDQFREDIHCLILRNATLRSSNSTPRLLSSRISWPRTFNR